MLFYVLHLSLNHPLTPALDDYSFLKQFIHGESTFF